MRKLLTLTGVLVFFAFLCQAQTTKVSGTVNNESNVPVRDASVTEKGTSNGTITDVNGRFSLTVKPNATLVITLVGYTTVEVAAKDPVNITLQPTSQNLSEVVVTALGIKREKRALGYSVATVGQDQLQQRPEGDLGRVLTGKAPGVNILNTSGISGSGTNIIVRAVSTISGSSQPLFIVDGVPFNSNTNTNSDFTQGNQTSSRFLDLDPNNIVSVSVLKGLSATTIYGEAGRNGVIVITTKNGSTQAARKKSEITVSQSLFSNKAILPDYETEYGGGFNQSLGLAFYSNWGARITDPPTIITHPYSKPSLAAAFPELQGATYEYKFYPSVKNFFRTGLVNNTSVNVAGSTGPVNFNANYSYLDDQGFTPGNNFYRNTFGLGGTAKLNNKFTLSGTLNYVKTDVKSPPTGYGGGSGSVYGPSVFGDVMYTPVTVDLMGLPYQNPLTGGSIYYRNSNDIQNPNWTVNNAFTRDQVNRAFGNLQLKYDITDGLSFAYRIGYDNYSEYQLYAQNKGGVTGQTTTAAILATQGVYRTTNGTSTIWDHTFLLNFNKNLSSDFSLNVDAGFNPRNISYSQNGMFSSQQLVYGYLDHSNFVTHANTSEGGFDLDYNSKTLSLGAFAQALLGYKDFLYLNVGGRNSWTSTLEKDNRSIFYPSGSVSFVPTSAFESLKGNHAVNYLKIRAGYATSASFPDPYSTRAALNIQTRAFLDASGTSVNTLSISDQLPNPGLKPELLQEVEAGVEGNFFNRRVNIDATVYNRFSKDQLLVKQLDPSTGYTSQLVNGGNVRNRGIELLAGYSIIDNANWRWHIDGLYNINVSKVSDIPEELGEIGIGGFSNLGTFAINGQPLGVLKGAPSVRYFKKDSNGNTVADAANGQRIVGPDGDYIRSSTTEIIGNPNPKYKLTGISNLSFKGFIFRMQWEYTVGGDMYAGTPSVLLGRGVTKDTEFDRDVMYTLPGVNEDGQPNRVQTSATQGYFNNTAAGNIGGDDLAVYDATVVRLRELSLSYQLPKGLLQKTPFGSVSLTLTGQNLFYYAPNFPKYVHFDPETSSLGVSNSRGLEVFSGPSSRRMGASIQITF